MYYDTYPSPVGMLWLTGRDGMLMAISFAEDLPENAVKASPETFAQVKSCLDDYFRGVPREIDFPMELTGTPFQKLIWQLLQEIPYGEVRTYGQLAKLAASILGKEKMSAQAVGQAVGHNPIAILVPCHRVVGTGGKLTGYAFGIEKKQWLLDHEQYRR